MTPIESIASDRPVRTRFAPSPTGFLHIGALRTALFSYLLARHHGGQFLLRIEDTDQNRLVSGSLQSIIESLRLMGMDYDEGPDRASVAALDAAKYGPVDPALLPESGGAHGPYFQSQRLPRYREVVDSLLDAGKAYYAFETKEELEAMRAAAQMRGEPFLYNRRYRDVPLAEARKRAEDGAEYVVRLKMPIEGPIRTVDALRGETIWDAATQDDFVILKADGFPPYHLAAMVDDYDMRITHALRGEEWLSSSPKHFCLFQALGWEPPVFVHTPSVLGPDGKKLSKRHGAKSVREFIDEGYVAEALVNFLALVGWSPGDDTEVMSPDEIIAKFGIDGISASPGKFDAEKLDWMNGVYLRSFTPETFARRALPFLAKAGLLPADADDAAVKYAADVLSLEQERLKTLAEAPEAADFFFRELPEYAEKGVAKWLKQPGAAEYLSDLGAALMDAAAWDAAAIEAVTREVGAKHGRERGDITHPVRVAVSGREVGPSLFDMMAVLGRERVLTRLGRAVELARA